MGLTSAVLWWEESQLRVLVLTSLVVQFLLSIFSFLRRQYIPGWFRFIMWLAYLAGDAVAIYALATLFNRHKNQDHGGSGSLEVVWAPVLLLHLGGHDGITAFNIEDNELWSRHLLTAVSQVTMAIYVFCKSWSGSDKRLLQAAILMFVPGVLKCFVKPFALKRASIYSLVSLPAAKQDESKLCLEEYVKRSKAFVEAPVREQNDEGEVQGATSSVEDGDHPQSQQGSDINLIRERLRRRTELLKVFVDLSSPYHRRLSTLQNFLGLSEKEAHRSVRKRLANAFLLLYTKIKTAGSDLILVSRVLPWASIGLFHQSHREAHNDIDVKITYAIFCCTAVLEAYSFFPIDVRYTPREEWPEMVAQYSLIGYFARNRKHSKWMWIVSLFGCNDFLDKHWCMESCFSSCRITKLVLGYLKDGWKEKIHDAASYRRFNDNRGHWALERNRLCSSEALDLSIKRPFDESVLLWHIATYFCCFSSPAVSNHRCAFAEVPTILTWARDQMRERRDRIREIVGKCARGTCSSVENNQTRSQCREELTDCKAVLCRQMSNYMVYLLFVNPEMLLPGSRRNLFTTAHKELEDIFKEPPLEMGKLTLEIRSKLHSPQGSPETFIRDAWEIAQELQREGDEKMWEVIQGVWVEMLCFSASRCRGHLHAKALGSGGEFLSYIWLLLSYMGMETLTERLQREELPSWEGNNSAAPLTSGARNGTASSTFEVHTGVSPSTSEIHITGEEMV